MRTLYLHIGTQKTGTSSLQRFCGENRAVFNRLGFEYPKMPFRYRYIRTWRNGHFLIGNVKDKQGKRLPSEERSLREQGYETVGGAFGAYDNVLLSDERLFDYSAGAAETFWDELLEHAREWRCAVKVIVYLRRQDQLALSWYNQMVKMGAKHRGEFAWEQWVELLPGLELDYCNVLERIAARMGRENICVRVYDRKQLQQAGGSLYADFLGCLGLQMEQGFKAPAKDLNTLSLTPNVLAIKCAVNASPHFERGRLVFRRAAEACSAQAAAEPRTSLFSPDEARAFLARYDEGNARIAREYLHRDGPLFNMEVEEDVEKWNVENSQMHEDLKRYFCSVDALLATQGPASEQSELPDTAAWLADFEDRLPAGLSVYGYAALCLGDFFIYRQSCIDGGVAVNALDDASVSYLVDVLLLHAREMQAAQQQAEERDRELQQAKAALAAQAAKTTPLEKARKALAHPGKAARSLLRKARGR